MKLLKQIKKGAPFAIGAVLILTGCSSSDTDSETKSEQKLDVEFSKSKGCSQDEYSAKAGVLKVNAINTGDNSGELEVLKGDRILGEVEKVLPSQEKVFSVKLDEGEYKFLCGSKSGETAVLTISKNSTGNNNEAIEKELADDVVQYKEYILEQTAQLQVDVKVFTDAIRANNVEAAKAAYPKSRQAWERIEPIAELFLKFDIAIDARVDDFENEKDPEFKGYHKLEWFLFEKNTTEGAAKFADQLDADIADLQVELTSLEIDPFVMTKGPQGLMEEVANGKITGEEDRYSGTDLYDFEANLEGSDKVIEILEDEISAQDAGFVAEYTKSVENVRNILNEYKVSETEFKNYEELTKEDINKLKVLIADLSEKLAEVPGILGIE